MNEAANKAPLRSGNGLESWIRAYREEVGPAADICVSLLEDLLDAGAFDAGALECATELLESLEALSADPVTICCAMMYVAAQGKKQLAAIREKLPAAVRLQLEDLEKLKHYESGQSVTDTERSAEGLRRLLLALVKDVRVVIDGGMLELSGPADPIEAEPVQAGNRTKNREVNPGFRTLRLDQTHVDLRKIDVLGMLVQLRTSGAARDMFHLRNLHQHLFDAECNAI